MCVIVTAEKGSMPTIDQLTRMSETNPDGAGIAWHDGNGLHRVRHSDNGKTLAFITEHWNELKATPCLIHFRLATHGAVNTENTHPFRYTLGNDEHGYIAHNGIAQKHTNGRYASDSRNAILAWQTGQTDLTDGTQGKFAKIDQNGRIQWLTPPQTIEGAEGEPIQGVQHPMAGHHLGRMAHGIRRRLHRRLERRIRSRHKRHAQRRHRHHHRHTPPLEDQTTRRQGGGGTRHAPSTPYRRNGKTRANHGRRATGSPAPPRPPRPEPGRTPPPAGGDGGWGGPERPPVPGLQPPPRHGPSDVPTLPIRRTGERLMERPRDGRVRGRGTITRAATTRRNHRRAAWGPRRPARRRPPAAARTTPSAREAHNPGRAPPNRNRRRTSRA